MAKAKTTTRGKARAAAPGPKAEPFPFVSILDKAHDVGRGIKSLENAAEGALIDSDGSAAINWMLEHLEREHNELVAMLKAVHAANGGANV